MKRINVAKKLSEWGFEANVVPVNWYSHIVIETSSGKKKTQFIAIAILSHIVGGFSGINESKFNGHRMVIESNELADIINVESRVILENIKFLKEIKAIETERYTLRNDQGKVIKNGILCTLNLRTISRITNKNRNTKKGSTVKTPKYEKTYYGLGVLLENKTTKQENIFASDPLKADNAAKKLDRNTKKGSTVFSGTTKKGSTEELPTIVKTYHGDFLSEADISKIEAQGAVSLDNGNEIESRDTKKSSTVDATLRYSIIDSSYSNSVSSKERTNTTNNKGCDKNENLGEPLILTGEKKKALKQRCKDVYAKFYESQMDKPLNWKNKAKHPTNFYKIIDHLLEVAPQYVKNRNSIDEIEEMAFYLFNRIFELWDSKYKNANGVEVYVLGDYIHDQVEASNIYSNISEIMMKLKRHTNGNSANNSQKPATSRGWTFK